VSELQGQGIAERAKQANIGNILKKLKAGKVLTAREIEEVEAYEADKAAEKAQAGAPITGGKVMADTITTAAFFGVSTMTISNWKQIGAPKAGRGLYDLKAMFDWWLENVYAPKNESTAAKDTRERFWAAKADNEELKRDHTKGRLVSRERMVQEFSERAADLRTTFRAYKHRLGPMLEGKTRDQIMQILGDENDRILRSFCRAGRLIDLEDAPADVIVTAKKPRRAAAKGKKKATKKKGGKK
jgi:phage terminase Nu1 subunit (DNA packaging protein)